MIEPSLPDLQDHISKFQSELRQMRQQFAARKAKLATLIGRRAELQAQLQQVESEITNQVTALAEAEPPVPTTAAPAASAPAPKAPPPAVKPAAPAPAVPKPLPRLDGVAAKAPTASMEPPSLRSILTAVLKAARKPASSGELARRVLAAGYKTTSKSLPNVIAAQLSKMDNIEHVKGVGYQLKR
jgi:cell division septum initiation protein DivIVA